MVAVCRAPITLLYSPARRCYYSHGPTTHGSLRAAGIGLFHSFGHPKTPRFFSNVPSGAPRISFRGHAGFRYVDNYSSVKGNGSQCSITERRVPELIPVLGSQPAGDVNHKPDGRLPLFSARPAVTPATFKRVLPISLLGEQEHSGCEQFAKDCYPTASRLRFEPGPFCA